MFALPYFLWPLEYEEDDEVIAMKTSNLLRNTSFGDLLNGTGTTQVVRKSKKILHLCPGLKTQEQKCAEVEQEEAFNEDAYAVMAIAATLLGFGNSALYIAATGYIDENTPKIKAPVFIGIYHTRLLQISH